MAHTVELLEDAFYRYFTHIDEEETPLRKRQIAAVVPFCLGVIRFHEHADLHADGSLPLALCGVDLTSETMAVDLDELDEACAAEGIKLILYFDDERIDLQEELLSGARYLRYGGTVDDKTWRKD